jgi:hypothetical protein
VIPKTEGRKGSADVRSVRAELDRNRIDGGMGWTEEIVRGFTSCKARL